jgi:hypothetical protein
LIGKYLGRKTFFMENVIYCLYNENQQNAIFTFSYILIITFYMLQAGLLLIIRRYCSVYTANGICRAEINQII